MAKSRYEITKKLGVGAMGEVWQATDTKLQRKIALKFMTASIEADEEYMKQMTERMHGEARFGAILNHPNIVQIYDFNRWKEDAQSPYNNRMYIAMELVEGTTLKSIINNSPRLSIIQSLNTGLQICEVLAYAHSQGVFHRDIKPDNIIITKDWTVKLLDFGLAKSINITTTLTKGQIIGTPHYMSPEQTEGKKLDHRTDIFSFGIIMYELLTGERPFPGQTFLEVFNAIRTSTPRPISELNSEVKSPFEKIVNRALEKDPDKRYQETSLIVEGLQDEKKFILLSDAQTIVMKQEKEIEQTEPKKNFKVKKLVLFLPVLVIVFVLTIYLSYVSKQEADPPVQIKQENNFMVPATEARENMLGFKSEAELADAQKWAVSSF